FRKAESSRQKAAGRKQQAAGSRQKLAGRNRRLPPAYCLLPAAFCLLIWLAFPYAALAHSRLLSSDPVAGSVLDSPPTQIQMSFSEGVGLEFSYIKLLDRSRAELPVGALSHQGGDPTQVSAGIGTTLRPGTYT